jgi:hypothetical protein
MHCVLKIRSDEDHSLKKIAFAVIEICVLLGHVYFLHKISPEVTLNNVVKVKCVLVSK